MNKTICTVVNGLLNRLESLSQASHRGWDDANRHRNELQKIRLRILDVVATQYPEGQLPDAVAVVHDHTIYRLDYVEGTCKVMGSIPRHLPTETELLHVLEVG